MSSLFRCLSAYFSISIPVSLVLGAKIISKIIYQIVYMYLQVYVGKWPKYHSQLVRRMARLLIAEIPSTF